MAPSKLSSRAWLKASTPLFVTFPARLPELPPSPSIRVPPLMVVPPVNVLAPVRIMVPAPAFTRPPAPEMAPANVVELPSPPVVST